MLCNDPLENVNARCSKSLFKFLILHVGSLDLCSATVSAGGRLIWKDFSSDDPSAPPGLLTLQRATPSSYTWQWQDFKCMRGAMSTLEACAGNCEMSLLLHSLGQSKSCDQPRPKGWGNRCHPKYYCHFRSPPQWHFSSRSRSAVRGESPWLVAPALNLAWRDYRLLSYVALESYLTSLGLSFLIYIIGKIYPFCPPPGFHKSQIRE